MIFISDPKEILLLFIKRSASGVLKVKEALAFVAVAFESSVIWDELSMLKIVAPAGIPVPVTNIPTSIVDVSEEIPVMIALPVVMLPVNEKVFPTFKSVTKLSSLSVPRPHVPIPVATALDSFVIELKVNTPPDAFGALVALKRGVPKSV